MRYLGLAATWPGIVAHATGTRSTDAPAAAPGAPQFRTLADSARFHAQELEAVKREVSSGAHHRIADELAAVLASNPYLLHGIADLQNYVWVSRSAERILGYEPEEMMGRPYIEFVHPEDRARTMALAHRMVHSPLPVTYDNRVLTADGGNRRMLWVATPYDDGRTFFLAIPVDVCPATDCARRLAGAPEG